MSMGPEQGKQEARGQLRDAADRRKNLPGKPIYREFKDSAFCILYGIPETARLLIQDLTGREYREEEIEIVTLQCLVGDKSKHNDLGVLVGNAMFFFGEEQSSECGNMPVRFLMYYAQTLQEYLDKHRLNGKLYRKKTVILPEPVFYVIDATGKMKKEYRLTEAFENSCFGDVELKVHVVQKEDEESKRSLSAFYNAVDYYTKNRHRSDSDNVREEMIQIVNESACDQIIKKRFL